MEFIKYWQAILTNSRRSKAMQNTMRMYQKWLKALSIVRTTIEITSQLLSVPSASLPLSNIHSPVTENLIGQGRSRCPNHIDLGPQIDTYNEEVKAIGQSDFSCISVSFWREPVDGALELKSTTIYSCYSCGRPLSRFTCKLNMCN